MANIEETVYGSIVIQGLESLEQNFKEFVVQLRRKGTKEIREQSGAGIREWGKWRSVPIIFGQCIKDTWYEFRSAVRNTKETPLEFTVWKQIRAGDSTPPTFTQDDADNYVSITKCALGIKLSVDDAYDPQCVDFAGFQWVVKYEDIAPTESDIIMEPVKTDYVIQYPGTSSSFIVYVWVRAVDNSGNHSAWRSKSVSLDDGAAGKVFVMTDAIVMG